MRERTRNQIENKLAICIQEPHVWHRVGVMRTDDPLAEKADVIMDLALGLRNKPAKWSIKFKRAVNMLGPYAPSKENSFNIVARYGKIKK